MSRSAPLVSDRCRLTRDRLPAFAAGTLGDAAAGDVRDHLLSCQLCSEIFGDLLLEEVEQGLVPLEEPPLVPPARWYDEFLRADHGRWGTFWKSVRDALEDSEASGRAWGEGQQREIESALASLEARPGEATPRQFDAEVVAPDGVRPESHVRFAIEEPPAIAGGQFHLRVSTTDRSYADALAVCTLQLPGALAVSFAATIAPAAADGRCIVEIREGDLRARDQLLPPDRLRFTVFTAGAVPRAR